MIKKYPSYKDSGVEWIGEIPGHWVHTKVKYVSKSNAEYGLNITSENYTTGGVRFLRTTDIDEYGKLSEEGVYLPVHEIDDKYLLGVGDFLISRSGTIGRAYIHSSNDSKYSYAGYLVRFRFGDTNISKFLFYVTKSNGFMGWLTSSSIESTIGNVNGQKYANFPFVLPKERNELIKVNSFLDLKASQIDTLIKKKQKMIELLKEERTAIINHAVTKGLNPDVKMKDSGIQWIGEIPEHWQTKKLKYSDLVIMGQSPNSEDYNISYAGLPFLQGNADFTDLYPLPRIYCETANKIAETNDILLSVRAPVGAVNIADQKYGIGRGLCAIRAAQTFSKYLYYEILCLNDELNSIGTGSTYTAISVDEVKNVLTTCPSLVEQTIIAGFLDYKTHQIDTLIAKEEKLIISLQEYRTALISEAVTGKIDVRDEVTV